MILEIDNKYFTQHWLAANDRCSGLHYVYLEDVDGTVFLEHNSMLHKCLIYLDGFLNHLHQLLFTACIIPEHSAVTDGTYTGHTCIPVFHLYIPVISSLFYVFQIQSLQPIIVRNDLIQYTGLSSSFLSVYFSVFDQCISSASITKIPQTGIKEYSLETGSVAGLTSGVSTDAHL